MPMRRPRLPFVSLILPIVSLAAACGGGGELSLEEYFERLDAAEDRSDEESNAAQEQLDEALSADKSEQEAIEGTRSAFNAFVRVIDDFLEDLEEIDAPAEAEEQHKEALAAGRQYAAALDDVVERLADADSGAELEETLLEFESEEFTAVDQRFTDSCFALEALAEENDIEEDLDCG